MALLQLTDSNCPTGGFVHSAGLEALVQTGKVSDAATLGTALSRWIEESIAPRELVFLSRAWWGAERDFDLQELAELRIATRPTMQLREAEAVRSAALRSVLEGMAGLEQACLAPIPESYVVLLGSSCRLLRIPHDLAVAAYGFQLLNGLTLAAVKLGVIGPLESQRLLGRLHPRLAGVAARVRPNSSLSGFAPEWEVAACQHASLPSRLFHT